LNVRVIELILFVELRELSVRRARRGRGAATHTGHSAATRVPLVAFLHVINYKTSRVRIPLGSSLETLGFSGAVGEIPGSAGLR
jgi:hypothetical protein